MKLNTEINRQMWGPLTMDGWKQERRDQQRAEAKRDAAICDCWKLSGPICARCKLIQVERERRRSHE